MASIALEHLQDTAGIVACTLAIIVGATMMITAAVFAVAAWWSLR